MDWHFLARLQDIPKAVRISDSQLGFSRKLEALQQDARFPQVTQAPRASVGSFFLTHLTIQRRTLYLTGGIDGVLQVSMKVQVQILLFRPFLVTDAAPTAKVRLGRCKCWPHREKEKRLIRLRTESFIVQEMKELLFVGVRRIKRIRKDMSSYCWR